MGRRLGGLGRAGLAVIVRSEGRGSDGSAEADDGDQPKNRRGDAGERERHLDQPFVFGAEAALAAAETPDPPSTASAIEAGTFRGVSNRPSSGRITRRWAK